MPLQIRRGTEQQRTDIASPFAPGELVYITDTRKLWIGDGTTRGGLQVTGFDAEDARDAVGAALVAGVHQNISFTYGSTQDTANRIDATVSLSNLLGNLNLNNYNITGNGNIIINGQLRADSFVGSIFPDGSALGGRALVDGISSKIELDGTVKGNIISNTNNAYDIGSSAIKFKNLYLQGSITASTITGNLTGNVVGSTTGYHSGDTKGSVFGDDSTKLVDAVEGKFYGGFYGDLSSEHVYVPDSSLGLQVYSKKDSSFSANYYNGTSTAKTAIAAGNSVGAISVKGWNGSSYEFAGALFASWEAGAVTTDNAPKSTVTIASGAGGTDNQFATLDSKGIWLSPLAKTTVYSVAGTALPSAVTMGQGARAFVSDATVATFATAYTGGGVNKVPVYSDGTVWRIG
jgi:hypothetical protein